MLGDMRMILNQRVEFTIAAHVASDIHQHKGIAVQGIRGGSTAGDQLALQRLAPAVALAYPYIMPSVGQSFAVQSHVSVSNDT
jgi:hypothetical protein